MSNKRYSFLAFIIICIGLVSGCDVTNANTYKKFKTFARTVPITYQGHKVYATTTAMAADGEGGVVITGFFFSSNRTTRVSCHFIL